MAREPDRCPVCGRQIAGGERVRAWPGKYVHHDCASYSSRRPRRDDASQPVHRKFTRR